MLAELGALALGSRLKRLADVLYRQASQTLDARHGGIAPNHVPIFACLDRYGDQSVSDLTRRLGVSQPAVTRMTSSLKMLELIAVDTPQADQRQSIIRLTVKGEELVTWMRTDYWPKVEAAAASLFEKANGDFLAQIAAVEASLKARSLQARIASQP